MADKRLILAVLPLAVLAACQDDAPAEGGTAPGQVLEGSISDEMLPVDTIRSEPPLADPAAFREVQDEAAADAAEGAAESTEGAAVSAEDEGEATEPVVSEPAPPVED